MHGDVARLGGGGGGGRATPLAPLPGRAVPTRHGPGTEQGSLYSSGIPIKLFAVQALYFKRPHIEGQVLLYEIPVEPGRILGAEPGDRVGYVASADSAEPALGVIRYVGPVKGLGPRGHWFGVELQVGLG